MNNFMGPGPFDPSQASGSGNSAGRGEVVSLTSRRDFSTPGRAGGANTPAPTIIEDLEKNNRALAERCTELEKVSEKRLDVLRTIWRSQVRDMPEHVWDLIATELSRNKPPPTTGEKS